MSHAYCCPNCRTNRSRFNKIKQVAQPVKLDPQNGMVIEEYTTDNLSPFHLAYKGPEYRIQCASCGLIEEEKMFIKFGEIH